MAGLRLIGVQIEGRNQVAVGGRETQRFAVEVIDYDHKINAARPQDLGDGLGVRAWVHRRIEVHKDERGAAWPQGSPKACEDIWRRVRGCGLPRRPDHDARSIDRHAGNLSDVASGHRGRPRKRNVDQGRQPERAGVGLRVEAAPH